MLDRVIYVRRLIHISLFVGDTYIVPEDARTALYIDSLLFPFVYWHRSV
jgi:hypothetical protein